MHFSPPHRTCLNGECEGGGWGDRLAVLVIPRHVARGQGQEGPAGVPIPPPAVVVTGGQRVLARESTDLWRRPRWRQLPRQGFTESWPAAGWAWMPELARMAASHDSRPLGQAGMPGLQFKLPQCPGFCPQVIAAGGLWPGHRRLSAHCQGWARGPGNPMRVSDGDS